MVLAEETGATGELAGADEAGEELALELAGADETGATGELAGADETGATGELAGLVLWAEETGAELTGELAGFVTGTTGTAEVVVKTLELLEATLEVETTTTGLEDGTLLTLVRVETVW